MPKQTLTAPAALTARPLQKAWTREGEAVLRLEGRLPFISGHGAINAYYARLGRKLLRFCEKKLLPEIPRETEPLLVTLDYRVHWQTERLLSLSCEVHGAADRRKQTPVARFAAVWDMKTGFPLPLRAFFPGARAIRTLRRRVFEETAQRCRTGGCLYYADCRQRARRHFCRENFYAVETGLVLFYPPLTLGPKAEGIPEFHIPWTDAGPRLPA